MLLVETFWCRDCQEEMAVERPSGPGSPEAACVGCDGAIFLWAELPAPRLAQPPAMSTTPARAVATPAA
jgi:hypothetical protein